MEEIKETKGSSHR